MESLHSPKRQICREMRLPPLQDFFCCNRCSRWQWSSTSHGIQLVTAASQAVPSRLGDKITAVWPGSSLAPPLSGRSCPRSLMTCPKHLHWDPGIPGSSGSISDLRNPHPVIRVGPESSLQPCVLLDILLGYRCMTLLCCIPRSKLLSIIIKYCTFNLYCTKLFLH